MGKLVLAVLGAVGLYLLVLVFSALLVNPKKVYLRHSRFYRWLLCSATAVALRVLRVRVHVTGREKLPRGERLLFVGNHISNFDPIVTWFSLKEWQIAFISKPENFKIPLFGRIIRKCCFLPIDRENPRNAITTIRQAADLLAAGEVSVGVYPEGTRSKTGALLPFHNGVFKIAQKANAAVAVVRVQNTQHIRENFPWQATDVYLDILDVIPARQVQAEGSHAVAAAAERLLKEKQEKGETIWQQAMC